MTFATVMATLNEMDGVEKFIEELMLQGKTHREISEVLRSLYPGQKGFSLRSVERFCSQHDMPRRTSRLAPCDLNRVVATAVSQVRINCMRASYLLRVLSICILIFLSVHRVLRH